MNTKMAMNMARNMLLASSILIFNHHVYAVCPQPPGSPPRIRIPGQVPGVIKADTALVKNKRYYSPDESVFLIFQKDGNLVLYKVMSCKTKQVKAIWNTHTWGAFAKTAVFQGDGNLVVYQKGGKALWNSIAEAKKRDKSWTDSLPPYSIDSQTYTSQWGEPILVVQNDNNLVIYDGNGRALWDSGTFPH